MKHFFFYLLLTSSTLVVAETQSNDKKGAALAIAGTGTAAILTAENMKWENLMSATGTGKSFSQRELSDMKVSVKPTDVLKLEYEIKDVEKYKNRLKNQIALYKTFEQAALDDIQDPAFAQKSAERKASKLELLKETRSTIAQYSAELDDVTKSGFKSEGTYVKVISGKDLQKIQIKSTYGASFTRISRSTAEKNVMLNKLSRFSAATTVIGIGTLIASDLAPSKSSSRLDNSDRNNIQDKGSSKQRSPGNRSSASEL